MQPRDGWRTSSFTDGVQCVQLRSDGDEVTVRNSNRLDAGELGFTRGEMAAFIHGVKAGEFDDLT